MAAPHKLLRVVDEVHESGKPRPLGWEDVVIIGRVAECACGWRSRNVPLIGAARTLHREHRQENAA